MNVSLRVLCVIAGCGGAPGPEPPAHVIQPDIVVLDTAPADSLVLRVEAILVVDDRQVTVMLEAHHVLGVR